LYDESTYFNAMRAYATAKNDEWYILSAKNGLVHPDTELHPYDEFGLSKAQATQIAEKLPEFGVDTVEMVAGKKYVEPLTPALETRDITIIDKFKGLKIGERVAKLNTETRKLQNQSLC